MAEQPQGPHNDSDKDSGAHKLKGSLTQWLMLLSHKANLEDARQSGAYCQVCGLKVQADKPGSLTQWIFKFHLCRCESDRLEPSEDLAEMEVDKGDPYQCYCQKTSRLLSESYTNLKIMTTFQSRFGPQEWLKPYTDKTLEELPKKGINNLLVICPGFASDCVETLEEINIQGRESFLSKGGKNFDLIPCLNDNPDHINLFEKLIKKYI